MLDESLEHEVIVVDYRLQRRRVELVWVESEPSYETVECGCIMIHENLLNTLVSRLKFKGIFHFAIRIFLLIRLGTV